MYNSLIFLCYLKLFFWLFWYGFVSNGFDSCYGFVCFLLICYIFLSYFLWLVLVCGNGLWYDVIWFLSFLGWFFSFNLFVW